MSTTQLAIKLIVTVFAGITAAAAPLYGFYLFWAWCMAQIPMVFAWAGLAKVGITIVLFLLGVPIVLGVAFLAGALVVSVCAALFLE